MGLGSKSKSALRRLVHAALYPVIRPIYHIGDLIFAERQRREMEDSKNPFNKFGAKFFSQNDEDGLTLEIIRRLEINAGTFVEIGVGSGIENNTLILLAREWNGIWIGGEELCFAVSPDCPHFAFSRAWVDCDNILPLVKKGIDRIGQKSIDLLSLDIDSMDLYVAKTLLEGAILPKVFIVEYNAKFPPPIEWSVPYRKGYVWDSTDFMGASFAAFASLLKTYGYFPVCCNITGSNAFFVRNDFKDRFPEVPRELESIFRGIDLRLYAFFGHERSPKTVESLLQRPFIKTN